MMFGIRIIWFGVIWGFVKYLYFFFFWYASQFINSLSSTHSMRRGQLAPSSRTFLRPYHCLFLIEESRKLLNSASRL